MQPKVSVIVPVYNPPAQYLRECLDSICNQTLKDIEIILIDNAAIGDNPQILKEYAQKDKRIKLFRFEENQGFSGACNKGLEIAQGTYFQVVDSDDLLVPEALAEEFEYANHLNADIVIFQHNSFNCNTNALLTYTYPLISLSENKVYELNLESMELFKMSKCAWNKLFNTKFIRDNNISFNNHLRVAAPDVFLSCQSMALAQKIALKKKSYYTYRQNIPTNVMSTLRKPGNDLYKQVFLFVIDLAKFFKEHELSAEKIRILSTIIPEIISFNYQLTSSDNKKAFKKLAKDTLKSIDRSILSYENICYGGYQDFYENFCQSLTKLNNGKCPDIKWLTQENRKKLFKTQPDVSVLVPVYNHNSQLVRRCFESLHAQTLQNMEILLINNGATDDNIRLIQWFESLDMRVRTINFSKNQGYGKAMNAGLKEANGKYIGIVETDDFIASDMYSELYDIAEKQDVDVVKSTYYNYSGETNNSTLGVMYSNCNQVLNREEATELVTKQACYWTAIYRRDLILRENIQWNETSGATGQDVSFILAFWCIANRFYFSDKAYYYRIDNENQSIYKFNTNAWGGVLNYQYLDNFLNSKNISPYCWKIRYFRQAINMLGVYEFVTHKKLKYYLLCSKYFKNIFQKKLVDKSMFSKSAYKKINKLMKHPLVQYVKDMLFSTRCFINYKQKSYCFNLIQKTSIKKNKKLRIAGIPLISKVDNNLSKKTFILGIPVKVTKYKNDTRVKKWMGGIVCKESNKSFVRFSVLGIRIFNKHTYSKKDSLLIQAINSFTRYTGHILDSKLDKIIPQIIKTGHILDVKLDQIRCVEENIVAHTRAQHIHPHTFGPYFGCHEGKDVVLVAAGPTLKYFTPTSKKIYCGVNRSFFYDKVQLDYLFIQDSLIDDMATANTYRGELCTKFYGIFPSRWMRVHQKVGVYPISIFDAKKANAKTYILEDIPTFNWPYDIAKEPLRDCCGCVFSALQFILYTHPKRIYLVGCDCTDGGHFYGGKVEKFSDFIIRWKSFSQYVSEIFPEIEIISINPMGLRGMFKDQYTASFIQDHPEVNSNNVINL